MIRPAVILVDVQNDFVTGKFQVEKAKNVIPALQRLVVAARKNNTQSSIVLTIITRRMLRLCGNGEYMP